MQEAVYLSHFHGRGLMSPMGPFSAPGFGGPMAVGVAPPLLEAAGPWREAHDSQKVVDEAHSRRAQRQVLALCYCAALSCTCNRHLQLHRLSALPSRVGKLVRAGWLRPRRRRMLKVCPPQGSRCAHQQLPVPLAG